MLRPAARAALWMGGALLSFSAMAIGGRELSTELNTFQILFFRSAVGLLIVGALLARFGARHARSSQLRLHVLRNTAHFVGQFGWFYGIALLPLAQVFAIEFTIPIWTLLLAAVFLGERLTRARVAAVAFGFVGMLVILRPGVVPLDAASLVVLISALGYGVSYVATKRLTATDSPLTVIFYMTLIQLPLALVPSLPGWSWPSAPLWPWIAVVGVTALSAHFCIARALRLADAMVVVPMDFLRLPLIAVIGYLMYLEPLDPWVMVGAAIMVAGQLLNLRAERR
ncbi:MAG TPA: DMT family transporter [Burkholderiaceae bacterium]|nr:DMT family transporter [Burkholderiaceae bacterium]